MFDRSDAVVPADATRIVPASAIELSTPMPPPTHDAFVSVAAVTGRVAVYVTLFDVVAFVGFNDQPARVGDQLNHVGNLACSRSGDSVTSEFRCGHMQGLLE